MSGAAADAQPKRKRKAPDRFGFDEKRSTATAAAAAATAVDADGDEPMHDSGGGGGGRGGGGAGGGRDERAAKRQATASASFEHFPTAAEIAVILNGLNTGAEVATGLLPELNGLIAAYAFTPVRWCVSAGDIDDMPPAQLSSDSGTAKTAAFATDHLHRATSTVSLAECARRGLRLRVRVWWSVSIGPTRQTAALAGCWSLVTRTSAPLSSSSRSANVHTTTGEDDPSDLKGVRSWS
jgi:hypothetical protein